MFAASRRQPQRPINGDDERERLGQVGAFPSDKPAVQRGDRLNGNSVRCDRLVANLDPTDIAVPPCLPHRATVPTRTGLIHEVQRGQGTPRTTRLRIASRPQSGMSAHVILAVGCGAGAPLRL
jgi:hypothetical protein